MRILQVAPLFTPITPGMEYGSIERVVTGYAGSLQALGHEVIICAEETSEVDVRLLGVSGLNYAAQASVIKEHVQKDAVDVIHTHNASSLRALDEQGVVGMIPIFAFLHGPAERAAPKYSQYAHNSDVHILGLSDFQANRLSDYCSVAGVVPNGVDEKIFTNRYQKNSRPYILTLGRVAAEKGITMAIAVALETGIPLVIAGPVHADEKDFFDEHIAHHLDNEQVRYIGPVTDAQKLPLLQQAAAVLQFSQVDETCSLTALEAMSCGTPVIATTRGSLPEMVIPGITGFLADDITSAVEALKMVGSVERNNVRTSTIGRYNWNLSAKKLISVYESFLR